MSVPRDAKLLATAAQIDGLQASVPTVTEARDVVQAASAGVGAAGHSVSWLGSQTLPSGEGFILATLMGDTVLTCPARGSVAESVNLVVQQDDAGGRSLILRGVATTKAQAFQLTESPGGVDVITLVWTGATWLAFLGGIDMAVPSGWEV